ncbi:MAG: hypothetical protein ACTS5I_17160, partial [Rhodanobacter sp.]
MSAVAARPSRRGYLALLCVWALGWTGYIMAGYYQAWANTGIEAPDMGKNILWGVLGGALVIGLAYAVAVKLRSGGPSPGKAVVAEAIPAAKAKPTVLELRGVGLRVDAWGNTQVWDLLKKQQDAYKSV